MALEVHVVERVIEITGLVILVTLLYVSVSGTGATLTTLGAWTALSALRTGTTLTTLGTLTTLTACGTLLIVGRLLDEYTVRELVLACLRVNLKQLNLYLVAFLDTSRFNWLKALPVNLADVEQTVLAGENLNEATVRHD